MSKPSKADLATAVKQARANLTAGLRTPVLTRQRETNQDREAIGSLWVSRVTFSAPAEDDARQIILNAIDILGRGDEQYTHPTTEAVQAQWTGYRAGVSGTEPEPDVSEAEKFGCLMKEVKCPVTILYMYGGAHYINGPAARRGIAMKLAQLTQGRCLIVQHRLAPQSAFPAQPLDVLIAYLSLLYPTPGAYHSPAAASHIVLAGDSSGAQLALSLIQTILTAQKQQASSRPTLRFNGRTVELPLPAGVAMQSPGLDHQGDCLPSWFTNGPYDIFPDVPPCYEPGFPADEAWPTNPPRGSFYCDSSVLCHPLVSPLAAKSWTGAPAMYISIGSTERNSDATRVVAQTAAKQGVAVIWDEYEFLPHVWPMVLKTYPQTLKCYQSWAEACSRFVSGEVINTTGRFTQWDDLKTRKIDVENVTSLSMGEVERLKRSRQRLVRPFTGEQVIKSTL
ncbi:hypothetical protein MMC22_004335 [Lobaria immixta]|nr:hypothetical protein [Lobaria immixta]